MRSNAFCTSGLSLDERPVLGGNPFAMVALTVSPEADER